MDDAIAAPKGKSMRRIGWLLALGAGLFALWYGLAAGGVLPRIPEAQRAALQRMRSADAPLPGRNATLGAYLFARNVPLAEWRRHDADTPEAALAALQALPEAADPYREQAKACQAWGVGCLAWVRSAPEAARALHAAGAARRSAVAQFERDYAHAAIVGAWNFESPLPPFGGLHAPVRLEAALRFADGDADGALQQLCGHAQFWRMLRTRTDLLLADMIGAAYLSGAAQGYAELLADLPSGQAPPAACTSAFAPLDDAELDQCRVLKGEFRGLENSLRDLQLTVAHAPGAAERLWHALGYRHEATMALVAPSYDAWCGEAHRTRRAARAEWPADASTPRCDAPARLFNPVGCEIADEGIDFRDYYHRLLDLDGRLRGVAFASALQREPVADVAAAFAARAERLRDTRQNLGGTRCAPLLGYDARKVRNDAAPWTLPLTPPVDCVEAAPAPAVSPP